MADQLGGASGNATAADLLSGYTASVATGPITGTMPNQGSPTFTPSGTAQSIPAGYYVGATIDGVTMKVATGVISGSSGTVMFNGVNTGTGAAVVGFSTYRTLTIPVPSAASEIIAVAAYMQGGQTSIYTWATGPTIFASPSGYADGAFAASLAVVSTGYNSLGFNATPISSGGGLSINTNSIVLPTTTGASHYYVVYYI